MTNKELEEKIASMEKELAELKSNLGESNQIKTIEPEEGEPFWMLTEDGKAGPAVNSKIYREFIKCGNYFKTKEEAEKQAEYNKVMNKFRKYVEAYSEPLDWNNTDQRKYNIYYDQYNEIISYTHTWFNHPAFQIYASSEQVLKDAIIYSAGSEEEFIRIVFGGK